MIDLFTKVKVTIRMHSRKSEVVVGKMGWGGGCCVVVGKVGDCSVGKGCGCNYCCSSKVTCYDWHFIQL
jgi:hypothetical protein